MKITKPLMPKHKESLVPFVHDFVETASKIALPLIPQHLATFPSRWPFPRGDLYHWIPLLNRFDTVLEEVCNTYALRDGPQSRDFTCEYLESNRGDDVHDLQQLGFGLDGDRTLIEDILNFSRLLLENCGNRSIYASSSHLNDLLNSTSLTLLIAVLQLGSQLAQRYQASLKRMGSTTRHLSSALLMNHYNINLDRVQQLAQPFTKTSRRVDPFQPPTPMTPGSKGKDKGTSNSPAVHLPRSSLATSYATDLIALGKDGTMEGGAKSRHASHDGTASWQDWGAVRMTYHLKSGQTEQTSATAPSTPTPIRRTQTMPAHSPRGTRALGDDQSSALGRTHGDDVSAPRTIEIPSSQVQSMSLNEVVKEYTPDLPSEVQYELLTRLRVAFALSHSGETRRQILAIRVLAITNLAYVLGESSMQERVLRQDADEPRRLQLVYQLTELIHPPVEGQTSLPRWLQTIALDALAALVQHPHKQTDISIALNTQLSHGVILYTVRKAVAEMATDHDGERETVEDQWRDALFYLVQCLLAQARITQDLATAGILPIFVEALNLRTAVAERNAQRILNFFDNIIYNARDAFQIFVDAGGLDALSSLMVFEVNSASDLVKADEGISPRYRSQAMDYQIPHFKYQTLKWLVRFIHQMMTSAASYGGNFDRLLRNLIDSPQLLTCLRQIIKDGKSFGSSVWANAVSIVNEFINNEPTSFAIIAEAGLSKAILEAVTGRELPAGLPAKSVSRRLSNDDHAHSDDENMDSSQEDSDPHPPSDEQLAIPKEHLAGGILPAKEAINVIPNAFSALCLNASGMKMFQSAHALESFFEIFLSEEHVKCLNRNEGLANSLGSAFDELVRHQPPLQKSVLNCTLDIVARVSYLCRVQGERDHAGAGFWVERADAKGKGVAADGDVEMSDAVEVIDSEAASARRTQDEAIVPHLSSLVSFLYPLFHNPGLRSNFFEKGGMEYVLDLAELPSLPITFAASHLSQTLNAVISALGEHRPVLLFPSLLKRTINAINSLSPFVDHDHTSSYFRPMIWNHGAADAGASAQGTQLVKSFIKVESLILALQQCIGIGFHRGGASTGVSALNLNDYHLEVIQRLGPLLTASILESIFLKQAAPSSWVSSQELGALKLTDEMNEIFGLPESTTDERATSVQTSSETSPGVPADKKSPQYYNYKVLRYLLQMTTGAIPIYFQAIAKVIGPKKHTEKHRAIADAIAEVLSAQLTRFQGDAIPDNLDYFSRVLDVVRPSLIDQTRPDERQPACATLVLQQLKERGGFTALNGILEGCTRLVLAHQKEPGSNTSTDADVKIDLAFQITKKILDVYAILVNGRSFDIPASGSQRDRDRRHYSSPQLLIEVRVAVLPMIRRLWESDLMEKAPADITELLIDIIRIICSAENEEGAHKGSDRVPIPSKPTKTLFKPAEESLLKLLEDYPRDLAEEALYRCNNNLANATDYCRAHTTVRSGGRNPAPPGEIESSLPEQSRPGSITPDANAMVLDESTSGAVVNMSESELTVPPLGAGAENDAATEDRDFDFSQLLQEFAPGIRSTGSSTPLSFSDRAVPSPPRNPPSRTTTASQAQVVTIEDLDGARAALRDNLFDRCLDAINSHGEVTFQVSDLINTVVAKSSDETASKREMGVTLVNAIVSFAAEEDLRSVGKKLAAYAHLLALLLQDSTFYDGTVGDIKENLSTFINFVKLPANFPADEPASWIPHVLLVIETLLSEDAETAEYEWKQPKTVRDVLTEMVVHNTPTSVPEAEREILFESILDILPRVGKNEVLALALLRVLVILTRSRKVAQAMGDRKNLQRLFVMAKQLGGLISTRLRAPIMMILRHIIEDAEVIAQQMRSEIINFFDTTRAQRSIDLHAYLRQLQHLVIRDPDLFVSATSEVVKLSKWTLETSEPMQRLQLSLKDGIVGKKTDNPILPPLQDTGDLSLSDIKPSTEGVPETPEKTKTTADHKTPVVEHPDGVIHFLLRELLNYREVEDKDPATSQASEAADVGKAVESTSAPAAQPAEPASNAKDKKAKQEFKPEEHPMHIYRCFILQCLAELLSCYNRTKLEFLNFKKNSPLQAMTPSKPRSSVINYLLFDLVPIGTLEHPETTAAKKRVTVSSWADSVITALLTKTAEHPMDRRRDALEMDDEPDLLFVRKFVLENILKAYKEAVVSTEPLDKKYSRMMSLAGLMAHIMHGKDNHSSRLDPNALNRPSPQLRRLMFEKGYIAALTSSIAEIDLNIPGARRAIKYILRPLKALTHTAIELSESNISVGISQDDEDEIQSASSLSEGDDEREDTPDLFRNSTLSMFDPGRDQGSSSEDDHDDGEELYEEAYDEGMDYDEEMVDDDEENVSDEDDEIEGIGHIEGLPGDHGVDVEVIMDDDDDDSDEDDSEDDSEEDSDDMEEDDDHSHMIDIIDEDGALHGEIDGDDDDWSDEEDGEDYDGEVDGEEGVHPHDMRHGPLRHLVRALGNDPEEAVEILEHFESGDLGDDEPIDLEGYADDGQDEADSEDDEVDDMDDEEILYDEYADGDLNVPSPFVWSNDAGQAPIVINHRGHTHQHRPRNTPFTLFSGGGRDPAGAPDYRGAYRSHRPVVTPRENDDGSNPLLQRSGNANNNRESSRTNWTHMPGPVFNLGFPRDGPGAILSDLISSLPIPGNGPFGRHPHTFHLQLTGPTRDIAREVEAMFGVRGDSHRFEHRRDTTSDPSSALEFTPQSTMVRWMDEAKMLFGSMANEQAQRVMFYVLYVLVPPAFEEDKRQKAAAEQKRKEEEQAERQRQEELAAERAREAEEQAAREKKEAEEREAALLAAEPPDDAEETPGEDSAEPQQMEGVESTTTGETDRPADAPRVMTTIRGAQVDITDLGIDPVFLEEIPEDLREEVVMSTIADRRMQAQDYYQDFLGVLPESLQEELLAQERRERARRDREEQRRLAAANNAANAAPQEMDAASILATFPPELRNQVLMEQDEDFLAQLPQELADQARALARELSTPDNRRAAHGGFLERGHASGDAEEDGQGKPQRRAVIQMLDKSGVATLLRLMFVLQHGSLSTTLVEVLQNISENRHNRAEVISTLLHILQDGSADMSAVERSFAHLSLRARQPKDKEPRTPVLKRTLTNIDANFTTMNSDISPLTVVQQCLNALGHLCQVNHHVAPFFLTEHDSMLGLKRSTSRKGKGKESKAGKYALNSLLSLLDRPLIMESSVVMEPLSTLLNRITQPLQTFERRQKEAAEAAEKQAAEESTEPATTETTTAEGTDANTAETQPETQPADTEDSKAADKTTKKPRPLTPPVIPDYNLKLVTNIFLARECSSRTFRETISTIKNLSVIPGAKAVFGRELIAKAQELAEQILVDLNELLPQIEKASSGTDIQGVALANFSQTSSDQNKLLRVLTALDHLFDPKIHAKPSDAEAEKHDTLAQLYESAAFGPMWERLCDCLNAIRQREHMLNVATILLPLIESLMVVCKNTSISEIPHRLHPSQGQHDSALPESRMESLFFSFTEDHRKILNDLVRHNPKLMSGTFSLLVKNPKVLDFDNKRNYFTRSIHSRNNQSRQSNPPLQLSVRRDAVFHDSYRCLSFKSGDEIKYGKLSIRFHGEEGVDAGGVTREWFQVLSRQMFDPGYALFTPVTSDRTTFHPNRASSINDEHLNFFKFIGRIIGKALYEGRVLDCHFSRAVYKRILGKSVSLKDMESLDLDYYKSLVWMLENDITDIITETFSVDNDVFGVVETVDLIPDGRNVPVTQENKHEYVRLVTEFKLVGSVQEQLDQFLKGFHDVIPAELIAIFNEQELELLISGLPDIDVDDWKQHTEYQNYNGGSPQIQWFWRAVRSFDKEERAKLLQFVTGTSKVPLNGFKELEGMNGVSRFNIHRDYGNKDRLPSSHTCFNQLDLPEYPTYEALRHQLLLAITAGSDYFGFA